MRADDPELRDAENHARVMRSQLLATLDIARARLAPAALQKEIGDRVKDAALDRLAKAQGYAGRHPGQVAAALAMVGVLLARKPLVGIFGRLLVKAQAHYRAHREQQAQGKAKDQQHG